MQRIEIDGNQSTESGFYVTTPVDWNGLNLPFDHRPITVRLNDSSWPGGADEDRIEVFTFDVDFDSQFNSRVTRTDIPTAPFDSFPCSRSGVQYACVPQKDGTGLDGIPEVIMNLPHLRNFGTHESMVLSFITDATNGANRSGIRWVELRKTDSEAEWDLYQEGTYAPNDGLDRFLPSIAMDSKGNIGLAYNVSSSDSYVGARFTGRRAIDPLGLMTVLEFNLVEGKAPISSGERFGDYSHMSVSPFGSDVFWWTTEYAGEGSSVTQTRIAAFEIRKDSFDLSLRSLINPTTGSDLTSEENVTVGVTNSGLNDIKNFNIELRLRDQVIGSKLISSNIKPEETQAITFDSLYDFSAIELYELTAVVTTSVDQNSLNDTLKVAVRHLHKIDVKLTGSVRQGSCTSSTLSRIKITSDGQTPIDSCEIAITVNGQMTDTLKYEGSISFQQSAYLQYVLSDLQEGENEIKYEIISVNKQTEDDVKSNNELTLSTVSIASEFFVTLEFKTDLYPQESAWELRTQGLYALVANGSFESSTTLYREDICINRDSCYVLVVNDSQGDGICCGWGAGSFNLYDNDGFILLSNDGNFGMSANENFCGNESSCSFLISISVTDASTSNSNDGVIFMETSAGKGPYLYSINGGLSFQEEATFADLRAGEYQVIIKESEGNCQKTETITIGTTTSTVELDGQLVEVIISPNPTSDIFKVLIKNLDIPGHMLTVQLLDISGQLLQERRIGRYSEGFVGTFSLMDYPQGTYLFRITDSKFTYMTKIVRTH
jgi:hypothetical protein